MPNLTCSVPIQADIQVIWRILLDKIENPQRYLQFVEETNFLEDNEDYVIREMKTPDMTLTEKITVNESMGEVCFELIDHPLFEGKVINSIIPPAPDAPQPIPVWTITMDWRPKNDEARTVERMAQADLKESVEAAAMHIKLVAEAAVVSKA